MRSEAPSVKPRDVLSASTQDDGVLDNIQGDPPVVKISRHFFIGGTKATAATAEREETFTQASHVTVFAR
jgi:hypothetical protein